MTSSTSASDSEGSNSSDRLARLWGVPAPNSWPEQVDLMGGLHWGFQPHFRKGLEYSIEAAMKEVGVECEARALLIGFKHADDSSSFTITIDPETSEIALADWNSLEKVTGNRFWTHADINLMHTDHRLDEIVRRNRLRSLRGDVMCEIVSAPATKLDRFAFFSGLPCEKSGYEIYPLVGIERRIFERVPRLSTSKRDEFNVTQSLVDAMIGTVLSTATRAMYVPDAGDGLHAIPLSPAEIARRGASYFLSSVLFCAGHLINSGSDVFLNSIASLPYEGRPGNGRILAVPEESDQVDVSLRLVRPVPLRNERAVRKLVEATGPGMDLLMSDGEAIGYGHLNERYDPTKEEAFTIELLGRGQWRLLSGQDALLSVKDGSPRLPSDDFDLESFLDLCDRFFPAQSNTAELKRIVSATRRHAHGAMVVISSDGAGEAQRLGAQAWQVQPTRLTHEQIMHFTEIDGALLFDPDGLCHGIGVILDGPARSKGDPARGSRFNNAVRYLDAGERRAVVVVLSADASIDVLPRIPRRVKRSDVEAAVAELVALASREAEDDNNHDADPGWKVRDRVQNYGFYLTQDQCDRANAALQKIHDQEIARQQFALVPSVLRPNPDMNDSYFWPEEER